MVELIVVSALGVIGALGALGVALRHTWHIEVLKADRSAQQERTP